MPFWFEPSKADGGLFAQDVGLWRWISAWEVGIGLAAGSPLPYRSPLTSPGGLVPGGDSRKMSGNSDLLEARGKGRRKLSENLSDQRERGVISQLKVKVGSRSGCKQWFFLVPREE